jgi:hypothetical protein
MRIGRGRHIVSIVGKSEGVSFGLWHDVIVGIREFRDRRWKADGASVGNKNVVL